MGAKHLVATFVVVSTTTWCCHFTNFGLMEATAAGAVGQGGSISFLQTFIRPVGAVHFDNDDLTSLSRSGNGLRRRRTRYTARYNPSNGVAFPETGGFITSQRLSKDFFLSDRNEQVDFADDLRDALFSMPVAEPTPSPEPQPVVEPTPSPTAKTPEPTQSPTAPPTEEMTPKPTPMMPSPTEPPAESPAEPPTREDRDIAIQLKCGMTALERSRDILTELLMVSDSLALVDPDTPQFQARIWLDNIDKALICPENNLRIHQRYRLALLYYQLGGGDWTVCNAVDENEDDPAARVDLITSSTDDPDPIDVDFSLPTSSLQRTPYNGALAATTSTSSSRSNIRTSSSWSKQVEPETSSSPPSDVPSLNPSDVPSSVPSYAPSTLPTILINATTASLPSSSLILSSRQVTCPGVPFLSPQNECEWYGMVCSSDYDPVAADMFDEYFPLVVLDLSSNNLNGDLFDELYGFEGLQRLSFRSNGGVSGNISSSINEARMTLMELDLGGNQITGTLPDSLFELTELKTLILFGNQLNGTIPAEIANLTKLNELQLQRNKFSGIVPDDSLLALEELVVLSIQENNFNGTLESLCEIQDERREVFEEYLSVIESDCSGDPPEVECSCCLCFR